VKAISLTPIKRYMIAFSCIKSPKCRIFTKNVQKGSGELPPGLHILPAQAMLSDPNPIFSTPCRHCLQRTVEHSNLRFESIRYANRFESIRLVKNWPFDSLVVIQFFLFIYCIVSAKKLTSLFAAFRPNTLDVFNLLEIV